LWVWRYRTWPQVIDAMVLVKPMADPDRTRFKVRDARENGTV
jgi:hypothetical protein